MKCKAIKAIYQVRDKALKPLPGCTLPTIRFSGSPDAELNHILEVLVVGDNVAVLIFSAALRYSGDQDSLSREVAALNCESPHGLWLFEPTPSIKQFCYLTWAHVDKWGTDKQTADLLWKTILFADSSYKQQARQLMQRAFGAPKLVFSSKKFSSLAPTLLNNLLSRLEETYGTVNVEQDQEGVQYRFVGQLQEPTVRGDFAKFQGEVTLGPTLCCVKIVFCQKAEPAAFGSRHHLNSLIDRLNKFNLTLSVGCFQFQNATGHVCFKYQFPWSGYQGLQLPQTLRNILLSLHSTLVPYFEQLQRFYETLREQVKADDSKAVVERFSAAEFKEEMKEIDRLKKSENTNYLLQFAYEIDPGTCSIKYDVPTGLQSLAEIMEASSILSQKTLESLIKALNDLSKDKAFYSHLPQILFISIESQCVALVPMTLTRHRTNSSVIRELMVSLCANMLESEQHLAESCTLQEVLEEIDPEELLDRSSLVIDPGSRCGRLGQTPVDLHFLDSIRTRLEMRNLIYQLKFLRKNFNGFRTRAYGIVIEGGRLALVTESVSPFLTLRESLKSGFISPEEYEPVSKGIYSAIEFAKQTGLTPLYMDIDTVRVRKEQGKWVPVFPFLQSTEGRSLALKADDSSVAEFMNIFLEAASTGSSNCSLP